MLIKSSTSIRTDYDGIVTLAKTKKEPVFVTRNGEGEMVFLPLELWEKREAENELLRLLLQRERNRRSGARTYSQEDVDALVEDILHEA